MAIVAAGLAAPAAHAGDYWDSFVRQYVQRLDGISPDAGNAAAVNTATHMIDPWPPYVGRRHFNSNGARMADAVERYRDVRKLPLAPPPIAPIAISPSGLSGSGAGAGATPAAPSADGK
jgi:hypothetical protein